MNKRLALLLAGATTLGLAAPAHAQHSGVDSALFRPSIDTSGVFSLEGARPMPRRDLSWKLLVGYAQKPFKAAVPGIGGAGDENPDDILDLLVTVNIAFGFQLSTKLTIGLDVAAFRTDTGTGYGTRGRYNPAGSLPSSGLISLRPLSNFDPSGGFEPHGLAGPLDARVVAKYLLKSDRKLSIALMGAAHVPFGDEEMFLGDQGFVLEPRLLVDFRPDPFKHTRLVANVGARLRERTLLEAYDPNTQLMADTRVVSDIGSEILAGAGAVVELTPAISLAAEAVAFVPLPGAISLRACTRFDGTPCSELRDEDYFAGAKAGDLAAYANAGVNYAVNPHLTINVIGGAGLAGQRRDDFRVVAGMTWSPQPMGVTSLGRGDRDGDGIPDIADACPEDPEDKDGFQDDDGCPDIDNDGDGVPDADDACPNEPEDRDGFEDQDGCPDRDNDGDGISDVSDRCPDAPEDFDGFEDDDGCPDDDNDGDGFPDHLDQCPNEPETVNGFEDDDGCPDTRVSTGPEEGADRINMKGNRLAFQGRTANLTNADRTILDQVAQLIRERGLAIRVEVHVALGTKSTNKNTVAAQKRKDKDLSEKRAKAVHDYLLAQGVPAGQIRGFVGLGSERPLGSAAATDPINDRVDFIKAEQ